MIIILLWNCAVIFYRVEPEGKLVMGNRRAPHIPTAEVGNFFLVNLYVVGCEQKLFFNVNASSFLVYF